MIQRRPARRRNEFPVGMTLVLVLSLIFMTRFVKVFLENETRDSHAYVQILNAGMPLVSGTYYDESEYEESTVDIKSLVKKTLGIDKINPSTILAAQLPRFNEFNEMAKSQIKTYEDIESFVLNDENISKKEKSVVNESGIRNPNIVKELDQGNPEVLMWHTHSAEGFSVSGHFTDDPSSNILGVGELIVKELEEYYGISVVHDKTKYDTMYTQSYQRSRQSPIQHKEKYGGFDVIIDLHRDAVDGNKAVVTTSINNEQMANIMFVDTRNSQFFEGTNAMNQRMLNMANELFPGLARGIRTFDNGKGKFNQDIMPNTTLIEVGAECNTPEEVHATAKYIARLIAEEVHYKNTNG